MKHFTSLVVACALLVHESWAAEMPAAVPAEHVFHHENVLGTSLELKVITRSPGEAARAEAAALLEIDRLSAILSTYDSGSEMSRWLGTNGSPVRVSPEMFEVLGLFDFWRERTGGALDAAVQSLCRIWKTAATRGRVPSPSVIEDAVAVVRQRHWTLDPSNRAATHLTSAPLVFNTFAKSYIASHACDAAMRTAPINAMVVNIGGDIVVRGDLTEIVSITDPRADAENDPPVATLRVRDLAVATSGDYRRGVKIGGRRYSHIVDPRSGQPVEAIISATVVAPLATDAGALATACCVLEPSAGLKLVASRPRAECLLITRDGSRLTSPGWTAMETSGDLGGPPATRQPSMMIDNTQPSPRDGGGSEPASAIWDKSFELAVTMELARFGGRSARPFVAVWIEDADKYPVRTLALWYHGARWLPDLRMWQRGEQLRALAEGEDIKKSVSSATRAPGRYTLKWDGRDNAGNPVKAGKYSVLIETAREHGTYQIIRGEMDFNGTAAKLELKANPEVSSASLDYHKKTDVP